MGLSGYNGGLVRIRRILRNRLELMTPTTLRMTELQQNAALAAACDPNRDTQTHRDAVAEWNARHAYNNETVPYLCMTSEQRTWVNRRAQQLKTELGG